MRFALALLIASFLGVTNSEATSYGRYEYFSVKMTYADNGDPNNCVMHFGEFDDGSFLMLLLDFRAERPAVYMYDPGWELPRNTEGSVIVTSGSFQKRYRIQREGESSIVFHINNIDKFSTALQENYNMDFDTPNETWPVDLSGSHDAYRAWQRCVRDLLEPGGAGPSNPWGGGNNNNPWGK